MGCQLAAINPIWSILIFSGTFRRGGRTIKMTILAQRTKGSTGKYHHLALALALRRRNLQIKTVTSYARYAGRIAHANGP